MGIRSERQLLLSDLQCRGVAVLNALCCQYEVLIREDELMGSNDIHVALPQLHAAKNRDATFVSHALTC